MTTERQDNRCNVALSGGATTQPPETSNLQDLARRALQESARHPCVAVVATVASVANVAQKETRVLLTTFARRIGVPTAVVDNLPTEELDAAAEQLA